jgi:Fe2+ or Zn2+ uptake regulation protein
MAGEIHDTIALRLHSVQQRYTKGREALVRVLAEARQPLSIPDILAADPKVPQSSAYRNLAALQEAGVVRRIATTGGFARYELAEDLTEHHHHLICTSCGNIEDFTAPASLERTLRRVTGEIAEDSGFQAEAHRLDLMGLCATCA